jgi:branched-chain amino acid transport system ATP-binding protein
MTASALSTRELSVSYGPVTAVRGVSLDVAPGEGVALLGPNGAGKSSLIAAVMGLPVRRQGRIDVAGRDVTRWPSHRRVRAGIAVVPEGRRVTGTLTVEENLDLGALWTPRRSRAANLGLVWELFPHLHERRAQLSATLSGGEQQMLAIGRAMMSEPSVIVMDEPTMGLAPKVVGDVLRAIRAIMAERKLAMLIAEQNAHAALAICSRGYLIKDGCIVHSGSADELTSSERLASVYLA